MEPGSPSIIGPSERVGSPFRVPARGRKSQQFPLIFIGGPVIAFTCLGVIPKVGYAAANVVDPVSVVGGAAGVLLDERIARIAATITPSTVTTTAAAVSRRLLRGPMKLAARHPPRG